MRAARRQPAAFDAPMFQLPVSQRDLLGLAWLCEKAALGCESDGDPALGARLRQDAAQLRAQAVNA